MIVDDYTLTSASLTFTAYGFSHSAIYRTVAGTSSQLNGVAFSNEAFIWNTGRSHCFPKPASYWSNEWVNGNPMVDAVASGDYVEMIWDR